VCHRLRGHAGYQAIQQIPGVGSLFAPVFVSEMATSLGSGPRHSSRAGQDSPRSTTSPIRQCTGARSPSRDHA
jgi:hypothetical protein